MIYAFFITIGIIYVMLLVALFMYARRQEKIFEDKIKKMTKEINSIIKFTENKQKEVERIKKKASKNE